MRSVSILTLALLAGCSMNPKLERPAPPVEASYPTLSQTVESSTAAALEWRSIFGDPRLQRLIDIALDQSRDLRIAVLNAEVARAQFRVQNASRLPAIEATGNYTRQRTAANPAFAQTEGFEFGQYTAQAALTSFEIDLFGRQRSLSQAAFARYLASEEGARAARITLIGTVADAYLAERAAAEQLALTEATLRDWNASLAIARKLRAASQNSGLDVAEAEGLARGAEADLQARRRALQQASNALALAVGAPIPADLPAPVPLMAQPIPTQLPAGLPSDLLERRPDIRQAEQELVAANAEVGAARAAFFPRISLTAAFGFASMGLSNLFDSGSRTWSYSPQVALPIFQGGQLKGNLDVAKLRTSVAVATYERAIQSAFREVADGLAGRGTFDAQYRAQGEAVSAAQTRLRLSAMRHRAGVDDRLQLLDAQRSLYTAQQAMLDLRQAQLSNTVGLYRALGGGWKQGD